MGRTDKSKGSIMSPPHETDTDNQNRETELTSPAVGNSLPENVDTKSVSQMMSEDVGNSPPENVETKSVSEMTPQDKDDSFPEMTSPEDFLPDVRFISKAEQSSSSQKLDEIQMTGKGFVKTRCGVGRWLKNWIKRSEDRSAWLLLLRVVLFNILTGVNFSSFPLFYVEYSSYFMSSTKAKLGMIVSIQSSIVSLGGIFLSWPMERFGLTRVAFVGSLVAFVGLATASFATSVPVLYVTQGAITGAGLCISSLPSPIVVQHHFTENRALASGLAMLGFSMGNIIGPIMLEYFITLYTWRGALMIIGAIMANRAPLGLTFWDPPNFKQEMKEKLKERGNSESNGKCSKWFRKIVKLSLLKDASFSLFCIGCFFQRFFVAGYVNHTPSRAVYMGVDREKAAFSVSFIFISGCVVRLIFSFVSNMNCVNRIGQYALGVSIGVVSVVVTLVVGGYQGIVVGSILFGVHIGMTHTIAAVVLVDLVGVENISYSLALFNFGLGVSTLISTPFSGWIYDVTGDYDLPFIIMGVVVFLGTIVITAIFCFKKPKPKTMVDTIAVDATPLNSQPPSPTLKPTLTRQLSGDM